MPVIKRKKQAALVTAVAGAGVLGSVQEAKADVYSEAVARAAVRTSEAGAGSDVIGGTVGSYDVQEVNERIRNVVENSGGTARIGTETRPLTDDVVADVNTNLPRINTLLSEYETLKASLEAQVATHLELTGRKAPVQMITVDADSYGDVANQLETYIQQMRLLKSQNDDMIAKEAREKSTASTLLNDVVTANKQITDASNSLTHYSDGIVGNLDKIEDKAEDSAKPGVVVGTELDGSKVNKPGVIVDVTKTNQINTVTTTHTQTDVTVRTSEELDRELRRILANLNQQAQDNQNLVIKAGDYKDQAFENIDDINAWLQKEQTRADGVQKIIDDNSTAIKKMDTYKESYIEKLRAIKITINNDGKIPPQTKADLIKKVDTAIANLEKSAIAQNITHNIREGENIDFGDIGRPKAEVDAIQAQASGRIDGAVNAAVQRLIASNRDVDAKMSPTMDKNKKSVDDFIDAIKSGRSNAQVDPKWLATRKLYRENPNYRAHITEAMNQGSSNAEDVLKNIRNSGNITFMDVAKYTTAAKASAAEYLYRAQKGADLAFGSPMMPSGNVNEFVTVIAATEGFARSDAYAGGAQGILDGWRTMLGGQYDRVTVFKDIQNQHINVAGNDNVLLFVSKNAEITYKLEDTFVYVDDKGVTQTADMLITSNITDRDGRSPREAITSGDIYYFHYASVKRDTGQFVMGGGYVPMSAISVGTGGGDLGSDTGEGGGRVEKIQPHIDGGGGRRRSFADAVSGILIDPVRQKLSDIQASVIAQLQQQGHSRTGTSNNTSDYTTPYTYYTTTNFDDYLYDSNVIIQPVVYQPDPSLAQTVANKPAGANWWVQDVWTKDISLNINVQVHSAAAKYAINAPLYVSDLDDGQIIRVDASKELDVISAYGVNEAVNGGVVEITSTNTSQTNQGSSASMDDQSILIFSKATGRTGGLISQPVGISKHTADGSYRAVDISLFAPFGIIGAPQVNVEPINYTVDTFDIADPSARAHTEGTYNPRLNIPYLKVDGTPNTYNVGDMDIATILDTVVGTSSKKVSSNTALIVRKLEDIIKRTSSDNTMIVRVISPSKRTSSGNTLLIRQLPSRITRTSSSNTLVTRILPKLVTDVKKL